VRPLCAAHEAGTASGLPVKLRRAEPVRVECELLVIRRGRRVLLHRTPSAARRMAGFWNLPTPEEASSARFGEAIGEFRHSIVNHRYVFRVRKATLGAEARPSAAGEWAWFDSRRLDEAPLATSARKGLRLAGIIP
jgi:adenine-specific DNA glycosylase